MKIEFLILLTLAITFLPCAQTDANFAGKEEVYDEKHIKQHMEEKLELGEKKMTPDEERFYYFSLNDLNKDNVIDGIEVWKAIHHQHTEEGNLSEPPEKPATDEEVAKSVDDVMKDMDINGDGVIDYSEYVAKVAS